MPRSTRSRMTAKQLRILLISGVAFSLLVKLWMATRLELYSDEIFYWLASTRPALAYSDLPFMTAWLAGLGSTLAGQTPLGVRSLFLALGATIPLLVVWVARPLTGERAALRSGLLVLCLPLLLLMGLLAVPDVPLIVLGLLTIGLAERATRQDRPWQWLATGTAIALGMCTHYRFILFPFTLFLFLVLSRQHWYLWRTGRLWGAGLIALVGLCPSLAFNLRHDLSGLGYHFVSRHPWSFQSEGLMHAPVQAAIVTPLLYLLLLFTLILLWKGARKGDSRCLMMGLFALIPLALYLLLAPWADTTRTTLHWPLSGYLPLLVYAPSALDTVGGWLRQRFSKEDAGRWLAAVPLTGLAVGVVTLAAIGSQGFSGTLQTWIDADRLSNKMAGWESLSDSLAPLLSKRDSPELLVTDNYYTAAQLGFYLGQRHELVIHTIDLDKSVRDGRLAQLQLWGMHESRLLDRHEGSPALFITEDNTLNVDEKRALLSRACRLFDRIEYREQWWLLDGLKPFSLYEATVGNDDGSNDDGSSCPMPSYAWLDSPAPDSRHRDNLTIAGWAFNDGPGIGQIHILMNGERVGTLERAVDRPDVVRLTDAHRDPQSPLVGFQKTLPLESLPSGAVTLELEVQSTVGERQVFGRRTLQLYGPGS